MAEVDPQYKILIFCPTKIAVHQLQKYLHNSVCLHGDLSQSSRNKNLNDFKESQCPILIATEIAARGLDIDNVTMVINIGNTSNEDKYVHKAGRTGRAGKTGMCLSIVNEDNKYILRSLQKAIGKVFMPYFTPGELKLNEDVTGIENIEKKILKTVKFPHVDDTIKELLKKYSKLKK